MSLLSETHRDMDVGALTYSRHTYLTEACENFVDPLLILSPQLWRRHRRSLRNKYSTVASEDAACSMHLPSIVVAYGQPKYGCGMQG